METQEVNDSILINASANDIFSAVTDSDKLAQWWPKSAYAEPKKGGLLRFKWFNDSEIETQYESFVDNEEVSFKFGSEFVKITLQNAQDKIKVSVSHINIKPSTDNRLLIHIAQTWTLLLINLKSYLEYEIDFRQDK